MPANMSLASQALEMWKKMEDKKVLSKLTLPIDLADYNLFRSMYHGGRVLATVACYDTPLWYTITNKETTDEPFFDRETELSTCIIQQVSNEEYDVSHAKRLKMVDVVSLYPYVMWYNRYPIGVYVRKPVTDKLKAVAKAVKMMRTIKAGKKSSNLEFNNHTSEYEFMIKINKEYSMLKRSMFRRCYIVDMDAREDFIIAFLMRKNEDPQTGQTKPEQSLAPLRNHALTGVELFEAIKVGYTLLCIHEIIAWTEDSYCFKKYIGIIFEVKKANSKDKTSALYQAAKLLMNALSGKFGQKIITQVVQILQKLPDDPDEFYKGLENIAVEVVESIKGMSHGRVGRTVFSCNTIHKAWWPKF